MSIRRSLNEPGVRRNLNGFWNNRFQQNTMNWKSLSGSSKAAIVFAALGFVISFTTLSTSSINGVQTCSYTDYGTLVFGALAMLSASSGLMRVRDLAAEARNLNLIVCAAADVVGVIHILRGMGIVGGPCA